jgi:hypothetical protein
VIGTRNVERLGGSLERIGSAGTNDDDAHQQQRTLALGDHPRHALDDARIGVCSLTRPRPQREARNKIRCGQRQHLHIELRGSIE